MKLKTATILVFLLGIFLVIVGSLFKIQHWPYGAEILSVGLLAEGVAIVLGIWKLVTHKKTETLD